MLDVIAAQRVERRKYSAVHARVYRIDQIKQHPAHKKRGRLKKGRGTRRWFAMRFTARLAARFAAFFNAFSNALPGKKGAELDGGVSSVLSNGEQSDALPKRAASSR